MVHTKSAGRAFCRALASDARSRTLEDAASHLTYAWKHLLAIPVDAV
jgi:hypothetical protein